MHSDKSLLITHETESCAFLKYISILFIFLTKRETLHGLQEHRDE